METSPATQQRSASTLPKAVPQVPSATSSAVEDSKYELNKVILLHVPSKAGTEYLQYFMQAAVDVKGKVQVQLYPEIQRALITYPHDIGMYMYDNLASALKTCRTQSLKFRSTGTTIVYNTTEVLDESTQPLAHF